MTTPTKRAPTKAAAKTKTPRVPREISREHIRQSHQRGIEMRLRRAEGQIRGVLRMVQEQASCEDVAQQLAAVRQALDRVFFEMMACSLEMEIVPPAAAASRQQRVTEILGVLRKYA